MKRLNQRGAVAALVAILLVLIMVCVSFVVDLGHIHNVKVLLQAGVDSGALSGALKIPEDPDDVIKPSAVAAFNTNMGGSAEPVTITVDNVEVGHWDKDALGQPASVRFTADAVPINAVKVTATLDVTHFFFWFLPSTTVTVDAIAVKDSVRPALPIVFVSCIPTNPEDTVAAPGLTVCDVAYYKFSNDTNDSAGWSSLAWKVSSPPVMGNFLTGTGAELFNEMIFVNNGGGLENVSVTMPQEYEDTDHVGPPDPSGPNFNPSDEPSCDASNIRDYPTIDIQCGLGLDFDGIATPPDPLRYGTDGVNSLPRWYHPEFVDLVTLKGPSMTDGLLSPATIQDQGANKQQYLKDLWYASTNVANYGPGGSFDTIESTYGVSIPSEFRDGRFARFIIADRNGAGNITLYDEDDADIMLNIDATEIARYAGYPQVNVNNGTITTLLRDKLLPLITDGGPDTLGEHFLTELNFPFDTPYTGSDLASGAYGQTVLLTVPVIFAGTCEHWKALSGSSQGLYYIGTANFLLTRAWTSGKQCFAADPADALTFYNQPTTGNMACDDPGDFTPAIDGDVFNCVDNNIPAAFEGVLRPPGGEELAAAAKVYLVE